jgi:DNA-binding transcriptional ArsR family regulator
MNSVVDRRAHYELADLGDAVGDSSRAAILVALMGGVARPATELARIAGVAPSTAASHFARLLDAGLVVVHVQGRHRYYALAGPHVAHAVEALVSLRAPLRKHSSGDGLVLARCCYRHLAGRLAIAFWRRAREAGWVDWTESAVTLLGSGRDALLPRADLPLTGSPCIDWTERLPHVAGPLGVAICKSLISGGWLVPVHASRALRITARGATGFSALGVHLTGA